MPALTTPRVAPLRCLGAVQLSLVLGTSLVAACSSISIQQPTPTVNLASAAETTKVVIVGNATTTNLSVAVDSLDFSGQMNALPNNRFEGDLAIPAGQHTLVASADVYCSYCTGQSKRSTATHQFVVVAPGPV